MAGFVERAMGQELWQVLLLVLLLASPATPDQSILNVFAHILQDVPTVSRAIKFALTPADQRSLAVQDRGAVPGDVHCFGELGCITTTDDFFHPTHRTFNLVPESRETIAVSFNVHSREDPKGMRVPALDIQQVLRSSFRAYRKTKIVIHGFMNSRETLWLSDMVDALLKAGDYNVVWVDWTDGSIALYSQAVANTRILGLEIAFLINYLKEHKDLNPRDVHLIGHSLGSHISGYVGERIPGLGRITGLDPAEPHFQDMPPSVRLDSSDALFVDIIHTDSSPFVILGGFGLREPIGHVDFYPNDGQNQPGCLYPNIPPPADDRNNLKVWHDSAGKTSCSHSLAHTFFIDSMISDCPFVAFRCSSYKEFKAGRCFSCGKDGLGCAAMGLWTDTWVPPTLPHSHNHTKLFLSTGTKPNFCLYHYELRLLVGSGADGTGVVAVTAEGVEGIVVGHVNITFVTTSGHTAHFHLTPRSGKEFRAGRSHRFLLEHGEDLSSSEAALVTWSARGRGQPCSKACRQTLPLAGLSLVNVEKKVMKSRRGARQVGSDGSYKVLLCPSAGQPVVLVNNGRTARLLPAQGPTCSSSAS